MSNILLIGKRHAKGNENLSGGVIVLFEELIRDFENRQIDYSVVDINYRNYHNNQILAFFLIYFEIFKKIFSSKKIMLNGSNNCLLIYAPTLRIMAWILRKPLYIRLFGGELGNYINGLNIFLRFIAIFSIKTASKIFYEPKHILERFKKYNKNSVWFPNVRLKTSLNVNEDFRKKIIFLGHVKEDKGINYLLQAYKVLQKDGYSLAIYGPEINYICPEPYMAMYQEVYKGAIQSDKVALVLSKYDVLVLPTFYKGEGYPGVIIEALNVGLPVVATGLDGIKEMIDDSCGVLIKPKDVNSLIKGILQITNKNYVQLSENAKKRFECFDSDKVMDRIINEVI